MFGGGRLRGTTPPPPAPSSGAIEKKQAWGLQDNLHDALLLSVACPACLRACYRVINETTAVNSKQMVVVT